MRFTFLFIIGLILVSGFIAYFGDLLGRKMGKKRLALFRLRPRYTAIVVTTITGMLISALALTALISVNSQFKKVFTQGELIIKQNEQLTKSNSTLEKHIGTLRRHSRELEEEVAERKKEVADARREAAHAVRARDIALKAVSNLEREIESRQKELQQLKKKDALTEAQLRDKVAELREVQDKMKTAQRELASAQTNLASATAKLSSVSENLVVTQNKLEDAKSKLVDAEVQIALQRYNLTRLENLSVRFTDQMYNKELIYRQGDELLRGTISPAQLNIGIEADLTELLENASRKAAAAGAASPPYGRCVDLIYSDPRTGQMILNEKESIKKAAEKISTSLEEVLVQIVCAFNATKGMQVPVELRLYVNDLVYKKGDKIASTAIDGSAKEVNVLFSLTDFLQQDVARTALRAGVVPIANSDPHTVQGLNPRSQFEELMLVVDQIRAENAPVYVDVYAAQDIYCKGPLDMSNMDFVIRKAE